MSSLAYKDKGITGHSSFLLGILKIKDELMHTETHDTQRADYLPLRLHSKNYLRTPAECWIWLCITFIAYAWVGFETHSDSSCKLVICDGPSWMCV